MFFIEGDQHIAEFHGIYSRLLEKALVASPCVQVRVAGRAQNALTVHVHLAKLHANLPFLVDGFLHQLRRIFFDLLTPLLGHHPVELVDEGPWKSKQHASC